MSLKRLIYISRVEAKIKKADIVTLMSKSKKNNLENHLSGMLLFGRGSFLQVLEGEPEALNKTFFKIAADGRHTDLRLIDFHMIEKRLFSNWSMKLFSLEEFSISDDLLPSEEETDYYPFSMDIDQCMEILLCVKRQSLSL